jgi:hypothetical protein
VYKRPNLHNDVFGGMVRNRRILGAACAVGVLFLGITGCGSDDSPQADNNGAPGDFNAEEYFAGKTIRVIVNTDAGTGVDLWARFLVDRLSEELPGHPRIAVTNEDGLGGTSAIYDAPEPDMVVGVSSRSSALYTTAQDPDATHDPAKIRVIGGIAGDSRAWTEFNPIAESYRSLSDAVGKQQPALRMAGAVGSPAEIESDVFLYPWLCEAIKLPCEYVKVATDTSTDVALMVERGEVNILAGRTITSIRDHQDRIEDGSARMLFEYASNGNVLKSPDGSTIPELTQFLPEDKKAEYEKILPIISSGIVGNMFWVGPATPDGAVGAMRDAYATVIAEPELQSRLNQIISGSEDGEQTDYKIVPMVGEEAQQGFNESTQTFEENLPLYTELQNRFWEQHWS